ncbi:hypothetical protein BT96DRAFT_1014920 [Gymnopus androsaceus JB14]|uniref:Exonuclease domain-containing protein n=1 Tax=Gymnopus androsaceus JB14 TaxID=1447944 RepID=A0A6A4I8W4_9AGAR|nr:hypothetical protein BT96DRAFT_1014920 [Gymnopus androsaceus JB14]
MSAHHFLFYPTRMFHSLGAWTVLVVLVFVYVCFKVASSTRRQSVDKDPDAVEQTKQRESHSDSTTNLKQPYDAFLVLDVEATCKQGSSFDYPNEIIEFPVCLMKWNDEKRSELVIVDEFRSFVKPSWRPTITEFCEHLTGITQSQVDNAPSFPQALQSVSQFLTKHGLLEEHTDGPFDVRDFVVKACFINQIPIPAWLRGDVIDINSMVTDWSIMQNNRGRKMRAKLARNHPHRPRLNIRSQLRVLGLSPFEGREHSGIDDARNIARIVAECARRNICLRPNTTINPNRRWYWMGKSGQVLFQDE